MRISTQANQRQIDELQLSLTITLPIKTWRELLGQMSDEWPGWELQRDVRDAMQEVIDSTNRFIQKPEAEAAS